MAAPGSAGAAGFFLFDRTSAAPNDRVTIRAGGTPREFTPSQRLKPFKPPIRLYLVRRDLAAEVHTRFDPRLNFVGTVVPDRNAHGLMTFSVPPLDAGSYTLAYWCPGCAPYSRGRTFFAQDPDNWVPRYRARGLLRIRAGGSCPVTLPNGTRPPGYPRSDRWYGNGRLWTKLGGDGIWRVAPEHVGVDGSIGDKLFYVTTPRLQKPVVSGERLDAAAPPLTALRANTGASDHMVPVSFPSAGCWRVTARVADVSVTYVVRVVVQ